MRVALLDHPFAPGAKLDQFTEGASGAGAVVSFTGIVRDENGRLEALEIEYYPGMTERALQHIAEEASARWDLADLLILHRHGRIRVGEPIMMVATAATHRGVAFEAAEFLMDYLKSRAPFWKKEIGPGAGGWVAAKDADQKALDRW